MGSVSDAEKQAIDESPTSRCRSQPSCQARFTLVISILALIISLATLTTVLVSRYHDYDDHHHLRPQWQGYNRTTGDQLARQPQEEVPRQLQARVLTKRSQAAPQQSTCNMSRWREVCHRAPRHHHHTIATKVTLVHKRPYVNGLQNLMWSYDQQDCVATCMGISRDDSSSVVIPKDGVYMIRVDLRANEPFANEMIVDVRVDNSRSLGIVRFPNTALSNASGNIEHAKMTMKEPPAHGRNNNIEPPRAAGLSEHQTRSLYVPLYYEKLEYLKAGNRISVRARWFQVLYNRHEVRPIHLDQTTGNTRSNTLQIFRV
ncbi:uncharacterized protein LOC135822455 [Sycon ciliatum]|uniref:uncharacterized protein LOC135822455 n=1 Tax=Sycon ciliatum TaxID=27933 RepID=UPI0031F6084A